MFRINKIGMVNGEVCSEVFTMNEKVAQVKLDDMLTARSDSRAYRCLIRQSFIDTKTDEILRTLSGGLHQIYHRPNLFSDINRLVSRPHGVIRS